MTKIRSIRVLSAAKVNALLYGILGLLIAPFLLLGPGLAMVGGTRRGFGGAVVVAAILPFFYGCIGFVAGAIMAFLQRDFTCNRWPRSGVRTSAHSYSRCAADAASCPNVRTCA